MVKLDFRQGAMISSGLAIIVLTYLFQEQLDFGFADVSEVKGFVIRKTLRVLLNDAGMILIIIELFNKPAVTRLALGIQIIDALVLLPLYFVVKLSWEGTSEISSPLLSQFHRLIVNPTLMLLLIPAVYFQELLKNRA